MSAGTGRAQGGAGFGLALAVALAISGGAAADLLGSQPGQRLRILLRGG